MAAAAETPFADHLGRGCVACDTSPLEVLFAISGGGRPPGDPDHNIGYDHRVVTQCPDCDQLQIEVYDHDCFDFDSVYDQYEWFVVEGRTDALLELVGGCERPLDRTCECFRHEALRVLTRHLHRRPWRFAAEHAEHVQRVQVGLEDGVPVFELEGE